MAQDSRGRNAYKPIPISAAKLIADRYEKDQVIVIAWDYKYGKTHVTTFGKTVDDCSQAAIAGNRIKRDFLGWPDKLCHAMPKRTVKRNKEKEDQ